MANSCTLPPAVFLLVYSPPDVGEVYIPPVPAVGSLRVAHAARTLRYLVAEFSL